jgi:hypothetical protein
MQHGASGEDRRVPKNVKTKSVRITSKVVTVRKINGASGVDRRVKKKRAKINRKRANRPLKRQSASK